jgi:hypothetical protein
MCHYESIDVAQSFDIRPMIQQPKSRFTKGVCNV